MPFRLPPNSHCSHPPSTLHRSLPSPNLKLSRHISLHAPSHPDENYAIECNDALDIWLWNRHVCPPTYPENSRNFTSLSIEDMKVRTLPSCFQGDERIGEWFEGLLERYQPGTPTISELRMALLGDFGVKGEGMNEILSRYHIDEVAVRNYGLKRRPYWQTQAFKQVLFYHDQIQHQKDRKRASDKAMLRIFETQGWSEAEIEAEMKDWEKYDTISQELLAVKQENHGIKQKLDELEITNRGLTVAVGRASGPNTEAIEADIHQADLEFKDAIKTAHKTFIGKIHDAVSSRGHDDAGNSTRTTSASVGTESYDSMPGPSGSNMNPLTARPYGSYGQHPDTSHNFQVAPPQTTHGSGGASTASLPSHHEDTRSHSSPACCNKRRPSGTHSPFEEHRHPAPSVSRSPVEMNQRPSSPAPLMTEAGPAPKEHPKQKNEQPPTTTSSAAAGSLRDDHGNYRDYFPKYGPIYTQGVSPPGSPRVTIPPKTPRGMGPQMQEEEMSEKKRGKRPAIMGSIDARLE